MRLCAFRSIFYLPILFVVIWSGTASAQETGSISKAINDAITPITKPISDAIFFAVPLGNGVDLPLIVVWLIAGGIFLTFRMGFINFRGFGQALRIVSGKYDNPSDPGEVTHFQALSAALSGTVGLGNIAGVAVAVSVGGPGATFWMILAGLFGMTTKFTECTLAVKYRRFNDRGEVSGGPMYYLSRGFADRGMAPLGRVFALMFAVLCIGGAIGAGNMFQVNQASAQFTSVISGLTGGAESFFADKPWIFGAVFAAAVGLVIIGGIKQIVQVTERLVPFMAGLYMLGALVILSVNAAEIPAAFGAIFAGAFTGEGVAGGVIGALIQGLRRATFSNEAGIGSAPIAHAAAKTKEPIAEGHVALLEPLCDTVIICTITALVIIVTGQHHNEGIDGVTLTSAAFGTVVSWFPYILSLAVVLFALSTSITWYYYSQRALLYLAGDNPKIDLAYKVAYLLILVAGSALQLGAVVDFADAMLFIMAIPNLIGLYLMSGEVRAMLDDYRARLMAGEIRDAVRAPAE